VGDIVAHNDLSIMYHLGEGVEKDEKKTLYHLEEAAIGGHDSWAILQRIIIYQLCIVKGWVLRKTCDGCKSVRYCSVKCLTDHRSQHKRECKKRAAELRDEILFKQPESSHKGDCPICFFAAIARSR